MASKRKYSYYIKGNKLALIEKGIGAGVCSLSGYSDQSTCEAAGGTWTQSGISIDDGDYKSSNANYDTIGQSGSKWIVLRIEKGVSDSLINLVTGEGSIGNTFMAADYVTYADPNLITTGTTPAWAAVVSAPAG